MAKKQKTTEDGTVDVRVLCDCELGRANDVIAVTKEQLASAPEGCFDASPEAIAYALTLEQNA